jgi:hypothetical protein
MRFRNPACVVEDLVHACLDVVGRWSFVGMDCQHALDDVEHGRYAAEDGVVFLLGFAGELGHPALDLA